MNPKSDVCKDCASWRQFREKCWFYWEGKKECSQYKDDSLSEPRYKNTKLDPDQVLIDLLEKK